MARRLCRRPAGVGLTRGSVPSPLSSAQENSEDRKGALRGPLRPKAAARFIPFGVRAAALRGLRFEKPNEDTKNRFKINQKSLKMDLGDI